MMVIMAGEPLQSASGVILIERVFAAPRALVFASWTHADDAAEWFAPDGFTAINCEMDATPGGEWRIDFRSPDGQLHTEYGVFLEVIAAERLVFTLTQKSGDKSGPQTTVTVTFSDIDGGTRMRFRQSGHIGVEALNANSDGWRGCFEQLAQLLKILQSA